MKISEKELKKQILAHVQQTLGIEIKEFARTLPHGVSQRFGGKGGSITPDALKKAIKGAISGKFTTPRGQALPIGADKIDTIIAIVADWLKKEEFQIAEAINIPNLIDDLIKRGKLDKGQAAQLGKRLAAEFKNYGLDIDMKASEPAAEEEEFGLEPSPDVPPKPEEARPEEAQPEEGQLAFDFDFSEPPKKEDVQKTPEPDEFGKLPSAGQAAYFQAELINFSSKISIELVGGKLEQYAEITKNPEIKKIWSQMKDTMEKNLKEIFQVGFDALAPAKAAVAGEEARYSPQISTGELREAAEKIIFEVTPEDAKEAFYKLVAQVSNTHADLTPVQQEAFEALLRQTATTLTARREEEEPSESEISLQVAEAKSTLTLEKQELRHLIKKEVLKTL